MKKIILAIIFATFYLIATPQEPGNRGVDKMQKDNQKTFSELKIYPNPCKQEKVTIESNYQNIAEISITNIAGKQVFNKKFISPENKSLIEISEVPNGMYLVKIKTSDDGQVVKKLIVSKE